MKSLGIFQAFGARKSEYNYSFFRAVAQSGSALPWGGRGPGFESRRPDKFLKESLRAAKPIPAERVIRIGRGRSEGAIAVVRKHTILSVPEGIPQSGGVGVMAAIPALLCS